MNKLLKLLLLLGVFGTTALVSCSSDANKVKDAQMEVEKAEEDLAKAEAELQAEVEQFKIERAAQISKNRETIVLYRDQNKNLNKEAKAEKEKTIAELEAENARLEAQLRDYSGSTKEDWNEFQNEFNNEMDELGVRFNNFFGKK